MDLLIAYNSQLEATVYASWGSIMRMMHELYGVVTVLFVLSASFDGSYFVAESVHPDS